MTGNQKPSQSPPRKIERVQTGVCIEKRLLKVLKGNEDNAKILPDSRKYDKRFCSCSIMISPFNGKLF
ncbi:MAG: hypothetical protein GY857_18330 [Desulfobacula sp.]|nr:hypothetical protein [Desulfobacula sp.]